MRKSVFFTLLILPFIFFNCTHEYKIKSAIKDYEWNTNAYSTNSIEIIGEYSAYFYKDSCKVLKLELEKFIKNKEIHLQNGLDSINKRIEKTETKINDTDNALMKRAIKNKLFELEKEKENHLKIIDIYIQNPEITQIGVIQKQIIKYQSSPNVLIGYVYQISSKGSEGNHCNVSKQKKYLLAPNLSRVFAEY